MNYLNRIPPLCIRSALVRVTMSSKTRILAVALSVVLIASVLGSGAALAAANETVDDGESDDLEDASTANETDDDDDLNETDDGDLNETEDDLDGNETLDENETGSVPFGMQVSTFVHGLIGSSGDDANATNDSNVSIGQRVAAFVTANNPGNAPDHAGPKNDSDAGPPSHVGAGNETGAPDHAGPGNETGKPAHAGPANETGQPDDVGVEADGEVDETDDDSETAGGNGGGPSEAPGRSGERGGGPP
jgi:hypothetical protein